MITNDSYFFRSNNWIYNVVNIFPVLLPALQHLKYSKLPHLHSSFLVMSSEFASIHTLTLEGLNHQSFCELVRLINRFKNLQEVTIFHCTCVSPINFRSKQHDLRCLRLRTVDPQFFDHLLKWGKKTKSGRALVELECDVVAESPVLDEILDSCSSTLRVLTIGLFHQDKLCRSD